MDLGKPDQIAKAEKYLDEEEVNDDQFNNFKK